MNKLVAASKPISAVLALALLSAALITSTLLVLRPKEAPLVAPQDAALPQPSVGTSAPVVTQAKVVPVRSAELGFARGADAVVAEVLVREGDQVEQGTLLARLDTRELDLRQKEAQLALTQARDTFDDLRIQQAELTLQRAELALEQATLRAPMAGTVVEVNLNAGELPSATAPAVVMADMSSWQIETTSLTEQDVIRIQQDAPVQITFSALPDLKLPGKVTQVKTLGRTDPNTTSATYTVIATPDQQDARLRWNMTATLAITPSE